MSETHETPSAQTEQSVNEADQTEDSVDQSVQTEQPQEPSEPPTLPIDRSGAREVLKALARSGGRRKRHHYSQEDVLLRFTSCGRCGVFLTNFRLEHGPEFDEALLDIEADWLALPWHADMREMVNKSYGAPIDVQSYLLEGSCPECRRPFSYTESTAGHPAWFLVKL